MTSRKKIIIIEDQIILNDMLKKIISNNYDVVATSDDASNLITLCEKYNRIKEKYDLSLQKIS